MAAPTFPLFLCSVGQLHNMTGFPTANYWMALRLASQRLGRSCCLRLSLDISPAILLARPGYVFRFFAVFCFRAWRRALHRKSPRKPHNSGVPRRGQRRSRRHHRSRLAQPDSGSTCRLASCAISVTSFLLIAFLKRDVALVAVGAMVGGIIYASVRALSDCNWDR